MKLKYTDYTARLEAGLDELGFEGEFNYADCASMLMPSSYAMERPYRLVVGGPAAGTVASAHFGSAIGKSNLLCGDVGGTSALLIGILTPDRFLGGRMPLNEEQAAAAFDKLDTTLTLSERISYAWRISLHNIAEGLLDITIRRSIDPREFSLVAFGAAGPMILPSLLDLLPLESVIVPPNPGTFSALGLLSSDQVYLETRTLYGLIEPDAAPRISELFSTMERELLSRARLDASEVQVVRTFDGRLLGQGFETPFIPVPNGELDASSIQQIVAAFHAHYERRNGTRFEMFPVEGVTYRVQVIVPSEKVSYPRVATRARATAPVAAQVTLRHLHDGTQASCYERSTLEASDRIPGPAIVWEDMSTTFIPHGRNAIVGNYGELVIA
jgi:N-methylhydantoinase A